MDFVICTEGQVGIVIELIGLHNTSRSAVTVRWSEGTTGTYRVGHHGLVEIKLAEGGQSEVGPCYHNHLPPVGK